MMHLDLFSPKKLVHLLNQHNIQAKKSLGQNFLIDRNIAEKLVCSANLSKLDCVVEVGAGCGALTCFIASKAQKVIAYEIDKRLISILQATVSENKNVEIRNKDALKSCVPKKYKVIGNLPYYISTRILRHFLSSTNRPQTMVVLMQKEVAQRVCAKPGRGSILSNAVQFYGDPKIVCNVSRNSFFPRPNVDSAILKINIHKKHHSKSWMDDMFFQLVKAGFSSKRKMLINNLSKQVLPKEQLAQVFFQAKLNPKSRAQELSIDNWLQLALLINQLHASK